ncbi:MAG: S-adenosylmethionine:tRNA ribosyltransferase-isomerase [Ktedonobacterales bacterium]|jgi:S-adenosylmethionine:tRNA ribosyltransferase-isomerase|nr:MAG: S-adenosylmethionine:tRNA ribosyltransferase-isomerase [Ktedonobacterales bacterium]
MRIQDFDYHLPAELIAQHPVEPRDSSRLLVLHRHNGLIEHRTFRDIGDYLHPDDLLVANQSRVLPARLRGVKEGTGGQVELLLLASRGDIGPDCWEALVRPGKRIHAGQRLIFGDGALLAETLSTTPAGGRIVRLIPRTGSVAEALAAYGAMPLPPYIHEPLADTERYQTVYAREPGSAAAPTAGLHFTPELLAALETQGIGTAFVTLHIGLDTFRPIAEDDLTDHKMHSEEIELTAATAARINSTRAAGGRIVAVGTTAVRTLESVAALTAAQRGQINSTGIPSAIPSDIVAEGERDARTEADNSALVMPYRGRTSLFIQPGYTFRAVDVMLTNFHLPRSTLVVLVSAFAGRDLTLRAYAEAVAQRYRFYSFGDAMLIL